MFGWIRHDLAHILAGVAHHQVISTWVVGDEFGDIVDLAPVADPDRRGRVVLCDFVCVEDSQLNAHAGQALRVYVVEWFK